MHSIPFLKLASLSSDSNPAKLFPVCLLWPATGYHRQAARHTALANKFRLQLSVRLFLFGTQSTENRWHVLQSEPHSDSFVGEPIQSVLLQSTSSAPIFEAVWFPLYSLSYLYLFKVQSDRADNFTIVNLSYNMQRWRF